MEAVQIVTPLRGKKKLQHKQISSDPLNKQWAEDKGKFGMKMLMKMGWSEGKGLGANENGMTDYIKPTLTKNREGLGVTVDTKNDWDVNAREMDDIFANLNAEHTPAQKESASESDSEEEAPKKANIPRHLIVQKRHKSKNVRNYSKKDLDAILGRQTTKTTVVTKSAEFVSDVVTSVSSEDIFEHFRKRAAEMGNPNDNSLENQVSEEDKEDEKKKKKKQKKEKKNIEEEVEEDDESEKKKKKEKKSKKSKREEVDEDVEEKPKKKKKSSKKEDDSSEETEVKDKKKEKKEKKKAKKLKKEKKVEAESD